MPHGSPLAHLLGVDGTDLGDAGHLDGAASILPQLQAAQRGVQQVPDHLVVDLGRGKELGMSPRSVGTRGDTASHAGCKDARLGAACHLLSPALPREGDDPAAPCHTSR